MAISSSWLVGSITLTSSATIVVDGVDNAVIAAGTYYLYDATGSLSLIAAILAAVTPHMTTPAIFVGKDRKLRVTAGASFTWTIPAALQDALGFGAAIGSTTSAVATSISNLLWSPGWPETPIGHPVGTTGYEVPNWQQTASPSGLTTRTTQHGTAPTLTELAWDHVMQSRVWTTANGLPGEFRRFLRDVLVPGCRWKLYSDVTEDDTSGSAVSWPTALGPYVLRDPEWKFTRSIANVDRFSPISIRGHVVSEVA
jgi:hypothetical protein